MSPPYPYCPPFTMAYLQFALICLFFGSNFIMMDRATRFFGPIEVGFGRLLSGGVVLALVWLLLERKKRLRWRELGPVLFVALVGNAYPYVAQPGLISQGFGHSFFGMTVAFTPLLTILVSIPLLGVHPTWRQIVGVLAGLGFVGLLMFDGSVRGLSLGQLAIAFTVPLSYAVANTWLRRTLPDSDPTPIGAAMMFVACLAQTPLLIDSPVRDSLGIGPPTERTEFVIALASMLWLGALGTGACVYMFVRLVQSHGPLFAGMVTYVVPVIALMWGLMDRETITTRQLVAVGGILAMVALVQAPEKKPDAEAEADPHAEAAVEVG